MHETTASPSSLANVASGSKSAQFVGFRLGDQQYAFRIEQIQKIVILKEVTAVPQVAEAVDGVANLRGSVIPIINLRALMGLDRKPADSETRTIVVNVGERIMGCTVDMVTQVIRIPPENIQVPPETVTAGGAGYISGFAKLDDQLVIVLDIDTLLDPRELGTISTAD